jgi:hypothetical protein
MPKLVPDFEYSADLVMDDVGPGPFGQRVIATVTGIASRTIDRGRGGLPPSAAFLRHPGR